MSAAYDWRAMSGNGYQQRAQEHRPADPEQLGAEVRRLAASGLKPRDIAQATGLHIGAVLQALQSRDTNSPRS
jgi:hypothetical protein